MSDQPLPPPPDVLAYGEFTLRLRGALNGNCVVPTNLAKRPCRPSSYPAYQNTKQSQGIARGLRRALRLVVREGNAFDGKRS